MADLGPLQPLLGDWEGNVGVDLSYHHLDDRTAETGYFEKARFRPIPPVVNGDQTMQGLTYSMTAWRHGEEQMDPFHDEVGYLLWEPATGQVMRCFAVPRGIALLAGGTAEPDATVLTFRAEPGSPTYGLVQNRYLLGRATCGVFESTFTIGNGTFSYRSDLVLTLPETGGEMHHTDRNTLHRTST